MAEGYVPYEERQRLRAEQLADEARAADEARRAVIDEVMEHVQRLGPDATDAFVEVLVPVRGLRKRRQAVVRKPSAVGGPDFRIDEVVAVHRIPEATYHHPSGDARGYFVDAFVALDGRVWESKGPGDSPNTWQLLARDVRTLDSFGVNDLRRICAAFEGR